ncbi:Hypothetical protein SRAE_0000052600 [Strongyloides ratti]|uniref:Uncharacterized protein n=1 Tax=Strongyloides ratti TaxID=34506 RepID=A0A090KZU5_STRRB|nr:Hypothetical protein SRAE_0000052600 [Strongyloides ratti]CEF61402.1 Hypothetical protein SRAE_0000052600 [Strongyloides ratti]
MNKISGIEPNPNFATFLECNTDMLFRFKSFLAGSTLSRATGLKSSEDKFLLSRTVEDELKTAIEKFGIIIKKPFSFSNLMNSDDDDNENIDSNQFRDIIEEIEPKNEYIPKDRPSEKR